MSTGGRAITLLWAALVLLITACSGTGRADGAGDDAADFTGSPIKLVVVTSLTGPITVRPEVAAGAQAAAAAINAGGGVRDPAGGPAHPVEIIVCDDRNDPNTAMDCAHEAVRVGAVAAVGSFSFTNGAYMPVLSKAGIPSVANYPLSAIENADPLSFPMTNWQISNFVPSTIAKSLGKSSLITIGIDTPTLRATSPMIDEFSESIDMTAATLYIPPSSKDYAPFAAQAAAADSALRSALNGTQAALLLQALAAQGVDPGDRVIIQVGDVISQEMIEDGTFDGVYMFASSLPPTDRTNPGVARYNDELDRWGDQKTPRNTVGIMSWAGVHIIAQLLDMSSELTSAELVRQMRAAGEIHFDPVAPFNWSAPIAASGPLKGTHDYTNKVALTRVVDGEMRPVVEGFVRFDEVFSPRS